jgi:hypothetical protein
MKKFCVFVVLALVVTTVGAIAAGRRNVPLINIDPNSSPDGFGVDPVLSASLGQSFTAVHSKVKWIGMHFAACPAPTDFQLTLRDGSGLSGTIVNTMTATVPDNFFGFVYFDASAVPLVVGNQYTADLTELDPPVGLNCLVDGANPIVYSGGTAFLSGTPSATGDFYLRVLTHIFAAQVQPPLNPDGSSTFSVGTVIPVSFTLTADGAPTCDLPPAAVSLLKFPHRQSVMALTPATVGPCKYTFNLPTGALSGGGTLYELDLSLTNSTPTALEVGSVNFTLN